MFQFLVTLAAATVFIMYVKALCKFLKRKYFRYMLSQLIAKNQFQTF